METQYILRLQARYGHVMTFTGAQHSLAWPDPFRAAAYRLEIISAALQGSGIVHGLKKIYNPQWLGSVNWLTRSLNRQSDLITEE